MDVFEILKQDHRKVSDLFERIEAASGQTKKNLFSQLKSELDLHAQLEESLFYPRLEKTQSAKEITLEAYEEHKVVKDLLAELSNGKVDEQWDAKLTVLKENVEHHVEEEEGELFDKAQDELSDDEAESIGAQMEAEKRRAMGGGAGRGANRRGPAKAASGGKKGSGKSRGGVLNRLANFVGLGESGSTSRKSAKSGSKKKSASKGGGSAGSKGSKKKSASKGSSKGGSKKSTKARGASKSSKKSAGGSKKKAAKKGGAKKR